MILSVANYLIRSGTSLLLLYLFFMLAFDKEKTLRFNRMYLLVSLIFSLLVPLFSFPCFSGTAYTPAPFEIKYFQDGFLQSQLPGSKTSSVYKPGSLIALIYLIITPVLLFRFLNNLLKIKKSRTRNPVVTTGRQRIVLVDNLNLPYSFFTTVYVNRKEYLNGSIPEELLYHEFAHIEQHHSLDIVFVELLRVIFWFNPLFYLYRKAIILNHEYLADEAAAKLSGKNILYQNILLETIFRKNNSCLASSFNYSFTKKRFQMMTKTNFSRAATFKKLITLPVFAFVGLLVLDAQDPPPPPPPPPPPQSHQEANLKTYWWGPVAGRYSHKPDPATSWYSDDMFETGQEYSIDNGIVSTKGSFIIARSDDNLYAVIRAKSAVHDLKNNRINLEDGKIEYYRLEKDTSRLFITGSIRKMELKIVDGKIAPPPPPPPPPPPSKEKK